MRKPQKAAMSVTTSCGMYPANNVPNEAKALNLWRLRMFGGQKWFKECPLLVQVAGDKCPIPVRLGAWQDGKGHVGFSGK
jgi:hypothetical protein